jgi:VanZ family protein
VHFVFYAVFAWLMFRALRTPNAARRIITVLVVIAIFAALDEFHQRFIPGRYMDVEDWVADMTGASIGLLLAFATRRRAVRA